MSYKSSRSEHGERITFYQSSVLPLRIIVAVRICLKWWPFKTYSHTRRWCHE